MFLGIETLGDVDVGTGKLKVGDNLANFKLGSLQKWPRAIMLSPS